MPLFAPPLRVKNLPPAKRIRNTLTTAQSDVLDRRLGTYEPTTSVLQPGSPAPPKQCPSPRPPSSVRPDIAVEDIDSDDLDWELTVQALKDNLLRPVLSDLPLRDVSP